MNPAIGYSNYSIGDLSEFGILSRTSDQRFSFDRDDNSTPVSINNSSFDFYKPNPPELEPTPIAPGILQPLAPLPYNPDQNDATGLIDDNNMNILLQGLFTTNDSAVSDQNLDEEHDIDSIFTNDSDEDVSEWQQHYNELLSFKRTHGHCSITPYNHSNTDLAEWAKNQRFYYKLVDLGKPSPLTHEQIRLLDRIGFEWDANSAAWDGRFEELLEYRQQHGHCNVPRTYRHNPQLSTWVKRQRRQYRANSISQKRIAKLESVGFIFDIVNHREQRKRRIVMAVRQVSNSTDNGSEPV